MTALSRIQQFGALVLCLSLGTVWSCASLADATAPCPNPFRELFEKAIAKQHPGLSFENFAEQARFVLFDSKIKEPLLLERLKDIYKDNERVALFQGVPAILKTSKGQEKPVELSTFWLNEVLLLDPRRDPIFGHPMNTIHPKLDRLVQKGYQDSKLFKKLPEGTMERVAYEDNSYDALDSGWTVISNESGPVAAARVFIPDYERALSAGFPPPPDRWLHPLERNVPEGATPFLTPEHRKILDAQNAMRAEINEKMAAAAQGGPEVYRIAAQEFIARLRALHRENQTAEIGRLVKSIEINDLDAMPQLCYGIWRLMSQKSVKKAYFGALTPVHRRMYEAEFFSPWKETGIVGEITDKNGKVVETVFSVTTEQLVRYLKKAGANGKLTPEQLRFLNQN